MATIVTTRYHSPCGTLILGALGDALCLCDWEVNPHREMLCRRICRRHNARMVDGSAPALDIAIRQLDEYFAGERTEFTIPLLFSGTPFQNLVYETLLKIPYGTTVSYLREAEMAGRPSSVRAVANANATNPISIFVPCHRVIGSNGRLTGYGGTLPAKEYLLQLEKRSVCTS